ncbi:unnamed protein product [Anisakis simplex]|uniref:Transcriptional regulator ATRX homolog n=1 Tax=Anisakis simplex TaxID=6269 RepID=A0A0M3JZ19_ANISI|nr:unnamed protein product [Anisakis simplex]
MEKDSTVVDCESRNEANKSNVDNSNRLVERKSQVINESVKVAENGRISDNNRSEKVIQPDNIPRNDDALEGLTQQQSADDKLPKNDDIANGTHFPGGSSSKHVRQTNDGAPGNKNFRTNAFVQNVGNNESLIVSDGNLIENSQEESQTGTNVRNFSKQLKPFEKQISKEAAKSEKVERKSRECDVSTDESHSSRRATPRKGINAKETRVQHSTNHVHQKHKSKKKSREDGPLKRSQRSVKQHSQKSWSAINKRQTQQKDISRSKRHSRNGQSRNIASRKGLKKTDERSASRKQMQHSKKRLSKDGFKESKSKSNSNSSSVHHRHSKKSKSQSHREYSSSKSQRDTDGSTRSGSAEQLRKHTSHDRRIQNGEQKLAATSSLQETKNSKRSDSTKGQQLNDRGRVIASNPHSQVDSSSKSHHSHRKSKRKKRKSLRNKQFPEKFPRSSKTSNSSAKLHANAASKVSNKSNHSRKRNAESKWMDNLLASPLLKNKSTETKIHSRQPSY